MASGSRGVGSRKVGSFGFIVMMFLIAVDAAQQRARGDVVHGEHSFTGFHLAARIHARRVTPAAWEIDLVPPRCPVQWPRACTKPGASFQRELPQELFESRCTARGVHSPSFLQHGRFRQLRMSKTRWQFAMERLAERMTLGA